MRSPPRGRASTSALPISTLPHRAHSDSRKPRAAEQAQSDTRTAAKPPGKVAQSPQLPLAPRASVARAKDAGPTTAIPKGKACRNTSHQSPAGKSGKLWEKVHPTRKPARRSASTTSLPHRVGHPRPVPQEHQGGSQTVVRPRRAKCGRRHGASLALALCGSVESLSPPRARPAARGVKTVRAAHAWQPRSYQVVPAGTRRVYPRGNRFCSGPSRLHPPPTEVAPPTEARQENPGQSAALHACTHTKPRPRGAAHLGAARLLEVEY